MSRTTTLVGYCLLAAAFVGCQLAGLRSERVPTIGQAVARITAARAGRWLLLAGWLWVGWHLFARSHS
ncbi:MAG: DUF6186 family protein [Actinomycetota bacterium]|nr:DUF6186 family protein [Actinomycetota bacterium]